MKQSILVSACLLGQKVRYDSGDAPCLDPRFLKWYEEGRFISICPEVVGGLPTPRPAAERLDARVVTSAGADVTDAFDKGAQATLELAKQKQVALAILKQNSPSCGSLYIYDGTFSGAKIEGQGMTAEMLRKHGFQVFGEDQLDEVERVLNRLEENKNSH